MEPRATDPNATKSNRRSQCSWYLPTFSASHRHCRPAATHLRFEMSGLLYRITKPNGLFFALVIFSLSFALFFKYPASDFAPAISRSPAFTQPTSGSTEHVSLLLPTAHILWPIRTRAWSIYHRFKLNRRLIQHILVHCARPRRVSESISRFFDPIGTTNCKEHCIHNWCCHATT